VAGSENIPAYKGNIITATENTVTPPRSTLDRKKGVLGEISQLQSVSCFAGFRLIYHAKRRAPIDRAIKYGRAGSIHEKAEAEPDTPTISADIGLMQHNEAAKPETIPAPAHAGEKFLAFILLYLKKAAD
jgi:hypothetical protein